jgi:hypothetical protein
MKKSVAGSAVLVVSVIFALSGFCLGVDTYAIDRVREKGVLDQNDFDVIEQFVKEAVAELVDTQDFTQVARLRSVIVTRQSAQAQYAEQYSKFLRKYIGEALAQSKGIEDAARRHRVRLNLMILAAELEDPRLIDIALGAVDDADESVQYWAVRALTDRQLIEKVRAEGGNASVMDKIAARLAEVAGKAPAPVISVMLDFCGESEGQEGEALLERIADQRIEQYAKWKATTGPADVKVLELLCDRLASGKGNAAEVGPRFCQLYSYAMQKYIWALKDKGLLSPEEKEWLASVLVETESKCIGSLTGLEQGVIKRAVELDAADMLVEEQGRLLGDATKAGVIPQKFGFDYGAGENGSRITQPRELPAPPVATGEQPGSE